LISGSPGYGKSALVHLLASESKLPLIETIAGNIQKPEDIYNLLSRLSKTPPYSILFIDEVHSINKEIAELLLPALQMFKVANRPIPYFTFAGATTDLGLLTKKLSPLVDRCSQQFILNPYTNEELSQIVLNIAKKRKINITDEALLELADRSRQTPRLAIGHLTNVYYYIKANGLSIIKKENVIRKLDSLGVHEKGITNQDIILLEYLNSNVKPIGQSTISQKLNIDGNTYLYTIEPFLLRQGFVNRTSRGRVIGLVGKEYLTNRRL
jgi:Holliday junction DNA helicase RuvB